MARKKQMSPNIRLNAEITGLGRYNELVYCEPKRAKRLADRGLAELLEEFEETAEVDAIGEGEEAVE